MILNNYLLMKLYYYHFYNIFLMKSYFIYRQKDSL